VVKASVYSRSHARLAGNVYICIVYWSQGIQQEPREARGLGADAMIERIQPECRRESPVLIAVWVFVR
jgi:hypothetical protein